MTVVKKAVYEKGFGKPVMSNDVKDHTNDPFFVEKLEKAKKTLSKITLPESVKNRLSK